MVLMCVVIHTMNGLTLLFESREKPQEYMELKTKMSKIIEHSRTKFTEF